MHESFTVYLAGPDVFLRDAATVGARKKALCAARGLTGLFPFDNEAEPRSGDRLDVVIYKANVDMIRSADFAVFNLTPFRGPSADVGTVYELGYARALGIPCFGYSNDARDLRTRVGTFGRLAADAKGGWRDAVDMSVEDFGNADNLMIDASFATAGAPIVRNTVPGSDLYTDLRGFEACLEAIVAWTRATKPQRIVRA